MSNNIINEPVYICDCCGQVVEDADDLFEVTNAEGKHVLWCEECVGEYATECEHCGELFEVDALRDVAVRCGDTERWCPDCVDRDATTCENCGELVANNAVVDVIVSDAWIESRRVHADWCPCCADDEAIRCDDCGELFAQDCIETEYVCGYGERSLCMSCREGYYVCEDCGDLVCEDEAERGDDDCIYCPNCIDEHRGCDSIAGYHHTRGLWFIQDDGTPVMSYDRTDEQRKLLYCGVELEVDDLDDRSCCADDITSAYDGRFIELKEDGSLSDDGFEIVSQPMTPVYHLTTPMWSNIVAYVRRYGGTSHDSGTCGLHIHLSRDFFKNHDAVYRLDRIFHRFERQLVKFSRRNEGQLSWCRLSDDSDLAEIEDVAKRKAAWYEKKQWAGRYEAVNDTNSATVEIRLWRGTLNMETLRATIELTAGLAIVANSMSDELAETLTWSMLKLLVRFALEQNGLPRNDLDSYLVRRCL